MCQLWVNLPAVNKMTSPRYQPISKATIPTVQLNGEVGSVRVIAGSFDGTAGPAMTWTPIDVWDVEIKALKVFDFTIKEGHTTIVFIRKGNAKLLGTQNLNQEQIVLLSGTGNRVEIAAEATASTHVLVLSGEPIDEPIAARGPFVMNTDLELRKAMIDYQSGNF